MVPNPSGLGLAGKQGRLNQGWVQAKEIYTASPVYRSTDTLIFLREYPVENVAMDGRIQSENPKILEAMKKISAGA